MDGIVFWRSNTSSYLLTVKKVLDMCKSNNATQNMEKYQIAVEELTFLGDRLAANGLKTDLAKLKPIVEFKTRKEQRNVARFLGMAKYLAGYTENLSQRTFHMRSLLKSNVVFKWDPEQEKEFNELKRMLASQPLIQFSNPMLPTKISSLLVNASLSTYMEDQCN